MTDISRQPDFACFSHIHTLQTSFQFSSHVSHHTTHSHTHDHTHTLPVFPIQTSHHSPRLSPLPSLSLRILPPLHPRFPLAFFPIRLSRFSDIHILSSTFYLSLSIHFTALLLLFAKYFNFLGAVPHVKKSGFRSYATTKLCCAVCVSQTILLKQSLQKRRVYVS